MAAASPATSGRATRLITQLSALFEDVAGTEFEGVDPATHFVELGLDSLSLTQVALQLQKTFALKITFRELMESCSSFESLAQHIDRLLPPETATRYSQRCSRRVGASYSRRCNKSGTAYVPARERWIDTGRDPAANADHAAAIGIACAVGYSGGDARHTAAGGSSRYRTAPARRGTGDRIHSRHAA
jgi:acyl carrier protein